jgi:hypothetical protein
VNSRNRWSAAEIAGKISKPISSSRDGHDIYVQDFDSNSRIGFGIDALDRLVLILPSQTNVLAFQVGSTLYDPSTSVTFTNSGEVVDGVSILRCALKLKTVESLQIVAAVMSGVIDIQISSGSSGRAIWHLKTLFENDFSGAVPRAKLTGFIGELLVIFSSKNPDLLVQCWHSDSEGRFDFSMENKRIEVKTNTDLTRRHYFRSTQITGNASTDLLYASVNLMYTDWGYSLAAFLEDMFNSLNAENALKVKEMFIELFQVPWQILNDYYFDLESSQESIKFFPDSKIPKPIWGNRIERVEWIASLDVIDALDLDLIDFLLNVNEQSH